MELNLGTRNADYEKESKAIFNIHYFYTFMQYIMQ